MKAKEFFGKLVSGYLWGNLLAMALVIVGLCFGVKYGLELYTHHNENIEVPPLVNMSGSDARLLLSEKGLEMVVTDSGYNKRLPADCILAQSPVAGMKVKSGHIVYVTINSPSSPSFVIPDIIDNSSYREAEAKLQALGFKLLPPKRVLGEKDWVYGIMSRGRRVSTGDRVSIETPLTLLIGNGMYGEDDDIDYMDPVDDAFETIGDEVDEFEEVDEPATKKIDESGISDTQYGE
jgi:beta-lactam-binding protein with PASTA domain